MPALARQIDLETLNKNIYADLAAQDEQHREEIANLTTTVNDLGNSLMEAGVQRKLDTDHALAMTVTLGNRCADLNERLRRAEKRLDNAATFGNGSIQDAFRLIRELKAELDTRLERLGRELDDSCKNRTRNLVKSLDRTDEELSKLRVQQSLADGCECQGTRPWDGDTLTGAAEGAIAHVPAPAHGERVDCECDKRGLSKDAECIYNDPCPADVVHAPFTGTPVAAGEAAPEVADTPYGEWRERTLSDATFLRYVATERYSFPKMVQDGLLRVAERLEQAAGESDGSWV